MTAADREQIGVVFDELPFNQTIFTSHLGKVMAGIYQNWDMELYQQYLKRFALPDKKELKEFSRGMKMKLSLAVALSHNAKLLILDEPTSGLDPVVRSEILDIFLEFISDGERSILVSSHITSDLERIADYITFIHQGKVLLSENKDEILYGYGIAKAGREQLRGWTARWWPPSRTPPTAVRRSSPTGNALRGSTPTLCSTRSTSTR